MKRLRGFTMFELVLVIVLTGIIAVVVVPVITQPIDAYVDVTRRSELVNAADAAMRRMARDVRRALPYSLRVSAGNDAFEMIRVADVAQYRENFAGNADRKLRFNNTDDSFSVLGYFPNIGNAAYAPAANERLVIFNLGSPGFDIYNNDDDSIEDVATVAGGFSIAVDGANNEHQVTLSPAHQFAASSPSHRIFRTDGEVAYACSGDGLYRIADYGFGTAIPATGTIAAGTLLTDNISSCSFTYLPGSALQPGLLVIGMTLSSGGETITLHYQIHVPNAT